MRNNKHKKYISLFALLMLLCCCGNTANAEKQNGVVNADEINEETGNVYANTAPGLCVVSTEDAIIDFSNAEDGYVMLQYNTKTEKKIKAIVSGPEDDYTYSIIPETWVAIPLSQGDGIYRVSLFENIEGKKYAQILTGEFEVELDDEFEPFIRPNVFVDYSKAPNSMQISKELIGETEDNLEKVDVIYDFVIKTLSYDDELAKTVKSGYVPDMDEVLRKGKGICFDYASLMTGMLRANGVPCKLVVGYVGDLYHAWISVWVDGKGWIDNAIYFDGTKWERLDPTLASAEKYRKSVAQFVGDGSNYSAKYYY